MNDAKRQRVINIVTDVGIEDERNRLLRRHRNHRLQRSNDEKYEQP